MSVSRKLVVALRCIAVFVLVGSVALTELSLRDEKSKRAELETRVYSLEHSQLKTPQPSGKLTFLYNEGFSAESREFIEKKIEPAVEVYYGKPWLDVDVRFTVQSDFTFGETSPGDCHLAVVSASVRVNAADSWGVIAHELGHARHTCNNMDPRFEEGIANCVSGRVVDDLALDPKNQSDRLFFGDDLSFEVNNRVGVGGGRRLKISTLNFLGSVREVLAGQAFCSFEDAHPGFLLKFHETLYSQLYGGADEKTLDLLKLGESVQPGFEAWFNSQPIFADRPAGNQVLIVALHHIVRIFPIQRDAGGNEIPLAGTTIDYSYSQNGIEFGQGSATLQSGNSNFESDLLDSNPQPQFGVPITISVTMGSLHDELTYTPTMN